MAENDESSEVEFPLPKGYKPPTSSRKDEEFNAIATFRIDEDEPDMIVLTKIEGVPVSSEKPDEDEEGPETSPELTSAIAQPEATNASSGMPAAASY